MVDRQHGDLGIGEGIHGVVRAEVDEAAQLEALAQAWGLARLHSVVFARLEGRYYVLREVDGSPAFVEWSSPASTATADEEWLPLIDLDFTALEATTIGAGLAPLGGLPWRTRGRSQFSQCEVIPGEGLVLLRDGGIHWARASQAYEMPPGFAIALQDVPGFDPKRPLLAMLTFDRYPDSLANDSGLAIGFVHPADWPRAANQEFAFWRDNRVQATRLQFYNNKLAPVSWFGNADYAQNNTNTPAGARSLQYTDVAQLEVATLRRDPSASQHLLCERGGGPGDLWMLTDAVTTQYTVPTETAPLLLTFFSEGAAGRNHFAVKRVRLYQLGRAGEVAQALSVLQGSVSARASVASVQALAAQVAEVKTNPLGETWRTLYDVDFRQDEPQTFGATDNQNLTIGGRQWRTFNFNGKVAAAAVEARGLRLATTSTYHTWWYAGSQSQADLSMPPMYLLPLDQFPDFDPGAELDVLMQWEGENVVNANEVGVALAFVNGFRTSPASYTIQDKNYAMGHGTEFRIINEPAPGRNRHIGWRDPIQFWNGDTVNDPPRYAIGIRWENEARAFATRGLMGAGDAWPANEAIEKIIVNGGDTQLYGRAIGPGSAIVPCIALYHGHSNYNGLAPGPSDARFRKLRIRQRKPVHVSELVPDVSSGGDVTTAQLTEALATKADASFTTAALAAKLSRFTFVDLQQLSNVHTLDVTTDTCAYVDTTSTLTLGTSAPIGTIVVAMTVNTGQPGAAIVLNDGFGTKTRRLLGSSVHWFVRGSGGYWHEIANVSPEEGQRWTIRTTGGLTTYAPRPGEYVLAVGGLAIALPDLTFRENGASVRIQKDDGGPAALITWTARAGSPSQWELVGYQDVIEFTWVYSGGTGHWRITNVFTVAA